MSLGKDGEPVLVIHGVANRDEGAFEQQVTGLEALVNGATGQPTRFQFVPIYWGDLPPSYDGLKDAIPGREAQVARLVAEASSETAAAGIGLPGRVGKIIDKAATLGPIEDWAERATSDMRMGLLPPSSLGLGDVLIYADERGAIQRRLWERMAAAAGTAAGSESQPISVLGHSLGGIIAFDGACSTVPPLHIKNLVTFGSQSAALHILDPRQEILLPPAGVSAIGPYVPGSPVKLPATVGSWVNIWHAMDPLAFLAGKVFQLADGQAPTDKRIEGQEVTWSNAHSCYWKHSAMAELTNAALSS
jgi:hypothetical protein